MHEVKQKGVCPIGKLSPELDRFGSDLRWWFHSFNRSTIDGYNAQDARKAVDYLKRLPGGTNSKKVSLPSLGGSNNTTGLSNKVAAFTVRQLLLTELKTQLFGTIDDGIYNELVLNSRHDIIPSP